MHSIELVIKARPGDIGGFTVARVLPFAKRRMVGPFIFFDHMGPSTFLPGNGIDVKPHPHIGLATVTYLYEGALTHRDSLGHVQDIHPGDVNWMIAGEGIVHSERTPVTLRKNKFQMHGIQTWVALPQKDEDSLPSFNHYPFSTLPRWVKGGINFRLIAGEAFGHISPVETFSKMFYIDIFSEQENELYIKDELFGERALYIAEGHITISGEEFRSRNLIVFKNGHEIKVALQKNTRCLLLGGESFKEKRFIWWNFVSSTENKIEKAKIKWKKQNFPIVPDENEFVPLPG